MIYTLRRIAMVNSRYHLDVGLDVSTSHRRCTSPIYDDQLPLPLQERNKIRIKTII